MKCLILLLSRRDDSRTSCVHPRRVCDRPGCIGSPAGPTLQCLLRHGIDHSSWQAPAVGEGEIVRHCFDTAFEKLDEVRLSFVPLIIHGGFEELRVGGEMSLMCDKRFVICIHEENDGSSEGE
jgi:hypothetical protein